MKIFLMVCWIFAMILTCGFMLVVYSMHMIPDLYLIVAGIVLALLLILVLKGIFGKKSVSKLISGLVCAAIIIVMVFATVQFSAVTNALEHMFDKSGTEISAVSVYVLKSNPAESLADLIDGSYAVHKTADREHVDEVINDLETENAIQLNITSLGEWDEMVQALYDGQVDALIINDAYAALLDDDSFIYKTKTISTSYREVVKEDISKDVDVTKAPFSVFISGNDIYGSIAYKSRSDVNMIVTVNPVTKQVLMTGIPRDYYVDLGCETGAKDKLTHAGIYGISCSVKTIEKLFDIDINYYVRVNFSTLVNVVDTLGGIEVYSDRSFTSYPDGIAILAGTNLMSGQQALAFSRERHIYDDGDRQRVKNQQAVLTAIIKKVCSPTIITKANSILSAISDGIETNMTSDEINSLIQMQLSDMAGWEILSQSVDGEGNTLYCYSLGTGAWVMVPQQSTVDLAKKNIQSMLEGTLTAEAMELGITESR